MILEQTDIKYNGRVSFERLGMSTNFERIPKLFVKDQACCLFLTKGAFQFETPTSVKNSYLMTVTTRLFSPSLTI